LCRAQAHQLLHAAPPARRAASSAKSLIGAVPTCSACHGQLSTERDERGSINGAG
jgi:cytochrome c553